MNFLLDTCIISKLRKIDQYPDKKLSNWIAKHHEFSLYISILTIGEIQSGISKLSLKKIDQRRHRMILENWLGELIARFSDRILPIDNEVALAWGRLLGENKQKGICIPVVDALIAASAIVHNLTIVTENINDFKDTGAALVNPWEIY